MIIAIGTGIDLAAQSQSDTRLNIQSFLNHELIDLKLDLDFPNLTFQHYPAGPVQSTRYLSYYHDGLGVFCKAENRIQDVSKIPFKFRLGSVQYVDWLESKPNTDFNFH